MNSTEYFCRLISLFVLLFYYDIAYIVCILMNLFTDNHDKFSVYVYIISKTSQNITNSVRSAPISIFNDSPLHFLFHFLLLFSVFFSAASILICRTEFNDGKTKKKSMEKSHWAITMCVCVCAVCIAYLWWWWYRWLKSCKQTKMFVEFCVLFFPI